MCKNRLTSLVFLLRTLPFFMGIVVSSRDLAWAGNVDVISVNTARYCEKIFENLAMGIYPPEKRAEPEGAPPPKKASLFSFWEDHGPLTKAQKKAMKDVGSLRERLGNSPSESPEAKKLRTEIISLLVTHFGDDPYLLKHARGLARLSEVTDPQILGKLTRAEESHAAKVSLQQQLGEPTWGISELKEKALAEAARLGKRFSPGMARVTDLDSYKAGQLYDALERLGVDLKSLPRAPELAKAYRETTEDLGKSKVELSLPGPQRIDVALLLDTLAIPYKEESGKIVLEPSVLPDAAGGKLRFLFQQVNKGLDLPSGPSKTPAFDFIQGEMHGYLKQLTDQIRVADQNWGLFDRTLYEVLDRTENFHEYKLQENPTKTPSNRGYRERAFTPDDFDLASGMLNKPKKSIPGINGAGNWMLAGFVPPGKSGSPNKEAARIIYWNGANRSDPGRTMRVAENWLQKDGKWELDTIEILVRRPEEPEGWLPFVYKVTKEGKAGKMKFDLTAARQCTGCHGAGAKFGPQPNPGLQATANHFFTSGEAPGSPFVKTFTRIQGEPRD